MCLSCQTGQDLFDRIAKGRARQESEGKAPRVCAPVYSHAVGFPSGVVLAGNDDEDGVGFLDGDKTPTSPDSLTRYIRWKQDKEFREAELKDRAMFLAQDEAKATALSQVVSRVYYDDDMLMFC